MSSDFRLLERIQKEKNIEKLRSLFIETVHSYESEMVGFHETNESQIDILQQQLSDSNASITALNQQIKKLKEMHDSEIDSERQKSVFLQKALQESKNETSLLQEKLQQSTLNENVSIECNDQKYKELETENLILKNQNQTLLLENKALKVGIVNLRSQLMEIKTSNVNLQQTIAKFYSTTKKGNKILKKISLQTLAALTASSDKVDLLKDGLLDLKEQVQVLKKEMPKAPSFDTRAFKVSTERKIGRYIEENQRQIIKAANLRQRRFQAQMSVNIIEAKNSLTSIRALSLSSESAFRLFVQSFKTNFNIMRKACMSCIMSCNGRIEDAKAKERKNTKAVRQELKLAQTEIELLRKEKEVAKEKRQKEKSKKAASYSSRSVSRISSLSSAELSKPKETLVSVGTLAHISTPHFDTMKERSKRASIEAEISSLESEVRRKQERITTLEGQIAGLRKIIKRNADTSEEENGKNRQMISDLEEQIREEKKANAKKSQAIAKIQKSLDDTKKAATRVEPLTTALNRIFKSCSDKLAPLLAEQSISPDLSELDELSKQYFNVPIHKICAPQFSRAYLKKQEHRFITAMQNDVDVEEMVKIFDAMIDEFVSKRNTSQQ